MSKVDEILQVYWTTKPPKHQDGEFAIIHFDAIDKTVKKLLLAEVLDMIKENYDDRGERGGYWIRPETLEEAAKERFKQ